MSTLLRRLRQSPVARFAVLLLLLGFFGLALLVMPRPDPDQMLRLLDRFGPLAPLAPVLIGAMLLIALVPRTFVTLAWGALFGPLGGAGYALAAALLAAALGFGIGRLLGRDLIGSYSGTPTALITGTTLASRARRRLAHLDGWFTRTGVFGVVTVRLLPIGGFGLVSYGYGTTGARLIPYLVGTIVASTPSAFGYAAVGAAVAAPKDINWLIMVPAGLGLIASGVIATNWWRAHRRGVTAVND